LGLLQSYTTRAKIPIENFKERRIKKHPEGCLNYSDVFVSVLASALAPPAQQDFPVLQLFFSVAAGAAAVIAGAAAVDAVKVAGLAAGASVVEAIVAEHEALSAVAALASLAQHAFFVAGAAVVAADS
jgi:hypothetical protein